MTSASTKRRHKRNAALFSEWVGTPIGQRVTVSRDNGEVLKTITASGPALRDGSATIRVEGIHGNTRLDRVRKGWSTEPRAPGYKADRLPWSDRAEKEIQRLRAAMVHAMDDAQSGAMYATPQSFERARFLGMARRLKAALEKK